MRAKSVKTLPASGRSKLVNRKLKENQELWLGRIERNLRNAQKLKQIQRHANKVSGLRENQFDIIRNNNKSKNIRGNHENSKKVERTGFAKFRSNFKRLEENRPF